MFFKQLHTKWDQIFSLPNLIIDIIAAFYLCANKQINETAELDLVGLGWPLLPLVLEETAVLVGHNIAKVTLVCAYSLLYLNEQDMFSCLSQASHISTNMHKLRQPLDYCTGIP